MNPIPRRIPLEGEPRYLRPGGNREVRRRRQRRTATRAILWCLVWLVGASAAGYGFRSAWQLLTDPERFPLTRVIVSGADASVNREVEAGLHALLGRNLLTIDMATVEMEAGRHPWVRGASVRRRLPSSLLVLLKPREVAGLVLAGDGIHMVDDEGEDVGRYGPQDAWRNHPILTGLVDAGGRAIKARLLEGIRAARRLEAEAPEFAASLSALDLARTDRMTATLRDFQPPVYLDPEDPLRNLDRLAAVRKRLEAGDIDTEYIDLRFKDRIVVMPIRTGEERSGA